MIEIKNIHKYFGNNHVLKDVTFTFEKGKTNLIIGESGSGKTTLIKILVGLHKNDQGSVLFNGVNVKSMKHKELRKLRQDIGMLFQGGALFDYLTVEENIILGLDSVGLNDNFSEQIIKYSKQYGLDINPQQVVGDLSVGARQRVEIIRCLMQNPKLLIMDEPTSVLTPQEVADLFVTLKKLAADGCAILYISHKLEEVREICSEATILRGGKLVQSCIPQEHSQKELAEMMIGKALNIEVGTAHHRRGVKMAKKIPPKSGSPGGKWHFFGVRFWGWGMTGRAHFYN